MKLTSPLWSLSTATASTRRRQPKRWSKKHDDREGAPSGVPQQAGPVIVELPLDKIRRPLMRTRSNDPDKVKDLMDSIRDIGLQVPMVAMRYGSLPVARKTGGSSDSVFDVDDDSVPAKFKNGYKFEDPTKKVAGGIWADKAGGKLVFGFGVMWWSVATIMTPVAAKLGLPYLL